MGGARDGRPTALRNVGYALFNEQRIDESIAIFELNVEDNPLSANAYESLASTYLQRNGQGDRERAIANLRKVLEVIPKDTYRNADFLEGLKRGAEAFLLENVVGSNEPVTVRTKDGWPEEEPSQPCVGPPKRYAMRHGQRRIGGRDGIGFHWWTVS
jgi:tetratricopeptide (TPR) repeat protein